MKVNISLVINRTSARQIRAPSTDRYLAIHRFFTRQTVIPIAPHSTTYTATRRFHSNDLLRQRCSNCRHGTSTSSPNPDNPNLPQRGHAQDYAPFIRRLIRQSKAITLNSPHRPSKEELLAAANGWWQRLRIRLKWFTIRGWRRFNTDDMSAFASWFLVGNTVWFLLGTTTFVSVIFALGNSLSLQESMARWISDYMTHNTGVTVIFESAIVPKWGSSMITFRNVYVSQRPSQKSVTSLDGKKGKQIKAATAKPPSAIPFLSSALSPETYLATHPALPEDNYTMFDININEVEVSLSFMRWLDGKGLVKDVRVNGARGVVDRRSVWWDVSKPLDPADFRHPTAPGDFEFESFHVEDALVTVYQPGGQRPYNISIFNAVIGPLRKKWLFYDMMSAEGITGQFDNCLFSLHMPQKLGKFENNVGTIKRMARFRIDGLPIEHAQYATGYTGPMSWITSGKLDAVLDIKFPHHPDDQVDLHALLAEIGRNVATISHGSAESSLIGVIPGQHRLARPPLRAPRKVDARTNEEEERKVVVDIDLRLRDLKAAVPIYTTDLSVTNNALIRPIVAFINSNKTLVPIHCQVAADLSNFEGSWTLFETGLMTSISDQIYEALAYHVSSETANSRRLRQVSVWGIRRGADLLVDMLRGVVDPVHAQFATV
nr:mitochondrial distribution and morphology protein 31 [Cryptococcus depauperatus CBS 7855]